MSTPVRDGQRFTAPFRVLFGLVAIATLLSNAPWAQPNLLVATSAYGVSLMWAVLAVFGNKAGWQRHLTTILAVAYLVLSVCEIARLTV